MSRVVGKGESVLLRKPPNLRADLSSRFKRCLSICFPLRSGFGERAGRSPAGYAKIRRTPTLRCRGRS